MNPTDRMPFSQLIEPLQELDTIPIDQMPPELISKFLDTKGGLESSKWGIVNRDPGAPTQGVNVGRGQWRGGRAVDVLNTLRSANPELAKQHVGDIGSFTEDSIWKNKDRIASWLGTNEGKGVQQQILERDFKQHYMKYAKQYNIQGAGAALLFADLSHRYGPGNWSKGTGASQFLNRPGEAPTTIADIARRLDESASRNPDSQNVAINYRRIGKYAKELGGTAGAVTFMHDAARSVVSGEVDINSLAAQQSYVDQETLRQIIEETSKAGLPEIPDLRTASTGGPESEGLTDEARQFRNKILMEILSAKEDPKQKQQQDPISILINVLIQHMLGGA